MSNSKPRRAPARGRALVRWLVVGLMLLLPGLAPGGPKDDTGGGIGIGSFFSPGPLAEPHAHLEGITLCTECHVAGEGVTPGQCMRCHDSVQAQVSSKRGFHADKGQACVECHPDHRGRGFDLIRMTEDDFDHDATGFSLTGAHDGASCSACHVEAGEWGGLPTGCADCHDDNHGGTKGDRGLLDQCESCHQTDGWQALPIASHVFAHKAPQEADFGLDDAHAQARCTACHADWRFTPIAHAACTDCHDDPHRQVVGQCTDCHPGARDWTVRDFDHTLTSFILDGQHLEATCRSCHGSNRTRRLAHETCAECHEDPHREQFAPRGCDSCHSVQLADFALDGFDHAKTAFRLTGQHAEVQCDDCHGEGPAGQFAGLAHEDCDSCHEDPHDARFEPTPCATCHSESGWTVDDFDHARTDFPLVGQHAEVECAECHGEGDWSGVAHGSCLDCHAEANPHGDSFDAASCDGCHTPDEWSRVSFDHAASTPFDLAPAHLGNSCESCHGDQSVFTGLSSECGACHEQTRPPTHYPGQCVECHAGAHWAPASLGNREHEITGFALEGAHGQATCRSCHAPELPFGSVPSTCIGCHQTDDAHQHQLGDRCEDCHQASSWVRTRWRHHRTGWPLRGSHRLAACTDCHATGYVGTPTECWRCHETAAPAGVSAHDSARFPFCDDCHGPYSWQSLAIQR